MHTEATAMLHNVLTTQSHNIFQIEIMFSKWALDAWNKTKANLSWTQGSVDSILKCF